MNDEDDLLPISALQHLLFCERQCALIHIERLWADNRLTVEGTQLHERADSGRGETRGLVRVSRALAIRSLEFGIAGRADVVEFHRVDSGGLARVVPVEYKRGRPKSGDEDRVQLCAQALCLEEMLDVTITGGALYYGEQRHRTDVTFDDALRTRTKDAITRLRVLFASGRTPRAARQPKCDRCSLLQLCLPEAVNPARSAKAYLDRMLSESLDSLPRHETSDFRGVT